MIEEKEITEHFVKCKLDNKVFKDVNNKSGILTRHLNFLNVKFNKNNIYEFYEKKENKIRKRYLKCPLCSYKTIDINNKSGIFTSHIKNIHNSDINEFCNKFPNYKKLWKMYFINKNRDTFINSNVENRIQCKICNMFFKKITETHLTKHNITPSEYKEKYNVYSTCSKSTTNKQRKISFDKQIDNVFSRIHSYNVSPLFSKEEYVGVNIDNKYKFKCNVCNNVFEEHLDDGNELICRICNPKLKLKPNKKLENEIYDFLKNELHINDIITNDRKVIYPKEVDIYIPLQNIAIEINGLYWHGEKFKHKSYHIEKTLSLNDKDIRCIHIFEDEWYNKKEIIKSKLAHILHRSASEKIYARKCSIKEISSKEKSLFLKNNHIQGNDKSFYNVGAYYNGILVSVMTFCKPRMILGYNSSSKFIELSRFCTDINLNVTGIGSKLFKYVKNNLKFDECITYADLRFSNLNENLYNRLNFKKISITKPNYFWCKNNQRFYRYTFNKQKLISSGYDKNKTENQIMHERNYYRIWDCGHIKYSYINK
jgi:hypothetical protein